MKQQRAPFGLRMPEDLSAWTKEKAQADSRSVNNLIVHILREKMEAEAASQKE